ncbi:MAG: low-specificity L-threonine aldolase [Bacteroidota bacterium]
MEFIDLRSDTVTKPSPGMREAMAKAEVGDDVFGEDPTVNKLQQKVAELLGKEAALYVPSGTMGNQVCIKVHTQPGDEVIAEKGCHVFNYETAGMAFLSNVQVHTIEGSHGAFTAEQAKRAIRPKAYYMPRTRLICIENTHNRAGGTIIPMATIKEIHALARNEGIRLHLDGARLWNASAETGISPKEYASYFDSVSVCLSKGLGAPVGSVIAGSAEFISEARRYRKIFGGGMREAGILAAAGIYALDNNIGRLKEDHANAKYLAGELSTLRGFEIDMESVQTNIIIISLERLGKSPDEVLALLKSRGVLLTLGNYMGVRAVTHLDVSTGQVRQAAQIIKETFQ